MVVQSVHHHRRWHRRPRPRRLFLVVPRGGMYLYSDWSNWLDRNQNCGSIVPDNANVLVGQC